MRHNAMLCEVCFAELHEVFNVVGMKGTHAFGWRRGNSDRKADEANRAGNGILLGGLLLLGCDLGGSLLGGDLGVGGFVALGRRSGGDKGNQPLARDWLPLRMSCHRAIVRAGH